MNFLNYVKSAVHNPIYLMLEIKSDPSYLNDESFRNKLVNEIVQQVRDYGLTERTLFYIVLIGKFWRNADL